MIRIYSCPVGGKTPAQGFDRTKDVAIDGFLVFQPASSKRQMVSAALCPQKPALPPANAAAKDLVIAHKTCEVIIYRPVFCFSQLLTGRQIRFGSN